MTLTFFTPKLSKSFLVISETAIFLLVSFAVNLSAIHPNKPFLPRYSNQYLSHISCQSYNELRSPQQRVNFSSKTRKVRKFLTINNIKLLFHQLWQELSSKINSFFYTSPSINVKLHWLTNTMQNYSIVIYYFTIAIFKPPSNPIPVTPCPLSANLFANLINPLLSLFNQINSFTNISNLRCNP